MAPAGAKTAARSPTKLQGNTQEHSTCRKMGLQCTQDRCMEEACMIGNLTLTYGGVTPCQALLGTPPRDIWDPESKTLSAKKRSAGAHASASEAQSLRLPSSVIFMSVNSRLIKFLLVQPKPGNFYGQSHTSRVSDHDSSGRNRCASTVKHRASRATTP